MRKEYWSVSRRKRNKRQRLMWKKSKLQTQLLRAKSVRLAGRTNSSRYGN